MQVGVQTPEVAAEYLHALLMRAKRRHALNKMMSTAGVKSPSSGGGGGGGGTSDGRGVLSGGDATSGTESDVVPAGRAGAASAVAAGRSKSGAGAAAAAAAVSGSLSAAMLFKRLGATMPPVPLPCIRASFNADAFIADHAPSRELVRGMQQSTMFAMFLRTLVPGIYTFDERSGG